MPNGFRIGDGAALTRKLSYYKLIFGTSEMVKLAIPPHYCQYDVVGCAIALPSIWSIKLVNMLVLKFHYKLYTLLV